MAARASSLILAVILWVPSAAAEPAEQKRACVAASTAGQIARDAGRLLEARRQLLFCARDACPSVVRKSCSEWLTDAEARQPSITLRVIDASGSDVADATVSVDGRPIELNGRPLALDPGPHEVTVARSGRQIANHKILLVERDRGRRVAIELPESPTPPGPHSSEAPLVGHDSDRDSATHAVPVGAWLLGGVGALSLGAFAYFGFSAEKRHDDLKGSCAPNCSDAQTSAGRRDVVLADVSLATGAVAVLGAVAWAIFAQPSEGSARVAVTPLRDGAAATFSGRF